MDFCNVSVTVLYDFEYTTKYGRNIKINSGERLLLIKKTNNDWWQVIRSSENRPFFVPASYVNEIVVSKDQTHNQCLLKRTPSTTCSPSSSQKDLLKINTHPALTNLEASYSKSSSSLSSLEKHDETHQSVKNGIYNTPHRNKIVSSTMTSSGYNSLSEEIPIFDEEEADYTVDDNSVSNAVFNSNSSVINESKSHPDLKSSFDYKLCDKNIHSPVSDKTLSLKKDNSFNISSCKMLTNKLHNCNDDDKYSTVNNPRGGITEVSNIKLNHTLPISDSLENLSFQIELKTNSLKNTTFENSKCNNLYTNNAYHHSDVVVSQNSYLVVDTSNDKPTKCRDKLDLNFSENYKASNSCENVDANPQSSIDNNKLQYHGSLKSNTEKQRWSKKSSTEIRPSNVFNCSEESSCLTDLKATSEFVEVSNISEGTQSKSSVDICPNEENVIIINSKEITACTKIDETLQKSESKEKVMLKRHFCFGSDSQLSHLKAAAEKATSRHSLDSVIEGELRDSCSEFTQRNHESKAVYPVVTNMLYSNQLTNSEKSSSESLLGIESERNYRKLSGGTTSDSLILTDGDMSSCDSETDSVKFSWGKQEDVKSVRNNTRKISLTRHRRVIASKNRNDLFQDPPSPIANQIPTRLLCEGWNEYDTQDGRKYFYNSYTKEKQWKPPRQNYNSNVEIKDELDSNATKDTEDLFVVNFPLPSGWQSEIDTASGQTCYIKINTGAKWFSSTDNEGRVYFFEENSNKSSWTLPDSHNGNNNEDEVIDPEDNSLSNSPSPEKWSSRSIKSKSMILATRHEPSPLSSSLTQNWPQLLAGTMCVLKEGPLNKTKITENGKRVRKNWTSTYAVLTELLLLFFKDNKGFPSMMSGNGRPELSVDLNGAVIDIGDKVSSRKNVYMLSTVLGLQVLIQCDCSTIAQQWLQSIQAVIENLPLSSDAKSSRNKAETPPDEAKINTHISRSKSMKLKHKSVSIEDMSGNLTERQTKIRERLKKFFHRRPTVDLLVKKGIWRDEPVFGCLLENVCPTEAPRVPLFVQHCIRCIEQSQENMKTDGLYRASGNLSQVQKIRLQVDQNIYSLLEQEEDVHVLAGTLKLFFRELKQPVIPFKFFNKALHASTNPNRTDKIKNFRDIVKSLPPCNYDTLKLLLQHLLRVTQYHEYNRMHIPNIAIVFGPTLMWPEQESLNMAFDLMQQNLVIECFLSDFHSIFHS